jgi:histidinol dehydrogenase
MTTRLDAAAPGFAAAFRALVDARRDAEADVRDVVAGIVADVRGRRDAALVDLTRRLDRLDLTADGLRVIDAEIDAAVATCPPAALDALRLAAARIRAFHERQVPEPQHWTDAAGVRLGLVWRAIDAIGIYVPGGTAAYPSSVLMNAIPAAVAGCRRIVMTVPAPDGVLPALVLAAARLAGVHEIYRIGGAQAVAALAFGTATIASVDKIVGPGNAYVAEAKRQVFGRVGIDMIAGPSEVVVVATGDNVPGWIAADLLAQAEHDARAQAVLVTDDAGFADAVAGEVERQLAALARQETAAASWHEHGAIVVAPADRWPALVDALAPEHLELAVPEPEALAARIRHAGAIFLGAWTPEVIGDYVGGPNHVLPTGRTARFSSGLGVQDFLKRTTLLGCGRDAFHALAEAAATLARAERLDGHAAAIERRRAERR